jgi:hypothetical protein
VNKLSSSDLLLLVLHARSILWHLVLPLHQGLRFVRLNRGKLEQAIVDLKDDIRQYGPTKQLLLSWRTDHNKHLRQ